MSLGALQARASRSLLPPTTQNILMLSLFLQDAEKTGGESKGINGLSEFFSTFEPSNLGEGDWWMELGNQLIFSAGPPILAFLAILFIGKILKGIIVKLIRKGMASRSLDETLIGFVSSLAGMLIMAFVVIAALGRLGIDTSSFAAIIAAAGLAIGFALQGSLGNFAAGVMLIIFRPFKKGDFIEGGGTTGVVEEIQIFCTMIRTGDNKTVIVPNSGLTGGNIVNYSSKPTRRVDMVFGIGYDDDIRQAKKVLEGLMAADDRILKDPSWTIGVSELADSSINMVCRPWVKSADYWGVFFDTHEAVKYAFDEAGLSIPYPQQDVHMFEEKKAS